MDNHGRKIAKELEKREIDNVKNYGLHSSERRDRIGINFRERKEEAALEYRTEYHRDRDRIIWSHAFKRLQHKTQIFPHYAEDHYRRRLTHSIEVAQIATTIARGLKLNEVAVEAMALGHDLGHTPFGHAGEEALNEVTLKYADKKNIYDFAIPIYGFDHCSHGIEVVSRLEKKYKKDENRGYFGLNLTFDVREGILKHLYHQDNGDEITKPFNALSRVIKLKEYKLFEGNAGSLEAQCVWTGDKISYFLTDIEDAFRRRIINKEDIKHTDFLKAVKNRYKDLRGTLPLNNFENLEYLLLFLNDVVLPTFILDIIDSTRKNIKTFSINSYDDVKASKTRIVKMSDDLFKSIGIFYEDCIKQKVFKHHEVEAYTSKAKKMVKELFIAYRDNINLIDKKYREQIDEAYIQTGICPECEKDLYTARCYLAGMSDAFATEQHQKLFMTCERAMGY